MSQKIIRVFHIFKKLWNAFLKITDCTQQLQVWENVVGFEKALGTVKVIKYQIQYRSQSLLNLARGYFNCLINFILFCLVYKSVRWVLAEFRHNRIVQSPHENYINVCRQHKEKWGLARITIIQTGRKSIMGCIKDFKIFLACCK